MTELSEKEPPQPFRLGELLVKEGYLTLDALNKVLEMQKPQGHISTPKSSYKPLGQLCLELNLLTREELQRVLRKYNKRIFIGELLVNLGWINNAQLEKALKTHKQVLGKPLGEVLLEQTALTESQLMDALSLQMDIPRMIPSLELIDQSLLAGLDQPELEQHLYLPMARSGNLLTVVMYDPNNLGLLELLAKRFACTIEPALAEAAAIQKTIAEYFKLKATIPPTPGTPLKAATASAETIDWQKVLPQMNRSTPTGPLTEPSPQIPETNTSHVASFLINNALKDRASDIHIEPQEKYIRIRFRIDGVLHHKTDLPVHLGPALITHIKQVCRLTPDKILPYPHNRGRIVGEVANRPVELSVATYPTLWGETMAIHIQEKQGTQHERLFNLERLGFSPYYLQHYRATLNRPGGLVLITGPARTGKTTTLYASANDLNENNQAILTAEENIENILAGVVQGAFDPKLGSYAEMIRAVTALDPNVLMINEIKGAESLQAALDATFTGTKVLTAFRAFEPIGGLLHLLEQGLHPYLVASSQLTILSQRLVRRLCQACKTEATPTREKFDHLGLIRVNPGDFPFYTAVGCAQCDHKGFDGQLALHEMIVLNEAIRESLLARKPAAHIRGLARTECGLVSMAEDGLYKAIEGFTSLDEVLRVACINEYDTQTAWDAPEIYAICNAQSN